MLDFNAANNITLQELCVPQSLKHSPESVKKAAQTLDNLRTKIFGESQNASLLRQAACVAPLFVDQELSRQTDMSPDRQKLARALLAQAVNLAGAVAYYAGDTAAPAWPGDWSTSGKFYADMNDLTLPGVAKDLGRKQLGEGEFGKETTQEPSFPLQGMLWWNSSRPFFEMTGMYPKNGVVHCRPRLQSGA